MNAIKNIYYIFNKYTFLSIFSLHFIIYLALVKLANIIYLDYHLLFSLLFGIISYTSASVIVKGYDTTKEDYKRMYAHITNKEKYKENFYIFSFILLCLYTISSFDMFYKSEISEELNIYIIFLNVLFLCYAFNYFVSLTLKSDDETINNSFVFFIKYISFVCISFNIVFLLDSSLLEIVSTVKEFEYVIEFFICAVIFKVSIEIFKTYGLFANVFIKEPYENSINQPLIPNAQMKIKKQISDEDIERIAFHEVAHLITHAALGALSHEVNIVVNDDYSSSTLGYVSGFNLPLSRKTADFHYWSMQCSLAGKVMEEYKFGVATSGCDHDLSMWEASAKQYFVLNNRFNYFLKPESLYEAQVNQSVLKTLQEEQTVLLRSFFDNNASVIDEMAKELIEKRKFDYKTMERYLVRIDCTGLTKPFGNFDTFNEQAWLQRIRKSA